MKLLVVFIASFITTQALFVLENKIIQKCYNHNVQDKCSEDYEKMFEYGTLMNSTESEQVDEYCFLTSDAMKCSLAKVYDCKGDVSELDITRLRDFQLLKTSLGTLAGLGSAKCQKQFESFRLISVHNEYHEPSSCIGSLDANSPLTSQIAIGVSPSTSDIHHCNPSTTFNCASHMV